MDSLDESHLSSCFRVTFSNAQTETSCWCYQRLAQGFIVMLRFCLTIPWHGEAETWCHRCDVFIYSRLLLRRELSWRTIVWNCLDLSRWRLTFQLPSAGRYWTSALWCFRFTCPQSGMFSVVSVQKIASFYLKLNSCLGLCCRNLPPDGFVYVSAYNPSSVCSMSWRYLQVNDGLIGTFVKLCNFLWWPT